LDDRAALGAPELVESGDDGLKVHWELGVGSWELLYHRMGVGSWELSNLP
jgi:hypothetical protein